jgi:hypothetical protein
VFITGSRTQPDASAPAAAALTARTEPHAATSPDL